MSSPVLTYARLERSFTAWAQGQEDIRAALVVGSRARQHPPPDEWSDLDLILFCSDPQAYAGRRDWLDRLGPVWITTLTRREGGEAEWLVLYQGGLKVDFYLASIPKEAGSPLALKQILESFSHRDVFKRGLRLLLDKNGSQEPGEVVSEDHHSQPLPTLEQFQDHLNRSWFSLIRAVKLLRRGELWQAVQQCNCDLRDNLLTWLEWEALTRSGVEGDIWYEGRHIQEWADPAVFPILPATIAGYAEQELPPALLATMNLMHHLGEQVAGRLGFPFPPEDTTQLADWVEENLKRSKP